MRHRGPKRPPLVVLTVFVLLAASCSRGESHRAAVRGIGQGPTSTSQSVAGGDQGGSGGAAGGGAAGALGGVGAAGGGAGGGTGKGTPAGTSGQPGGQPLPIGGPGGGKLPVGVTDKTITISAIAGFSGNYGAILNTIYDRGFGTWVDDTNAHGGINGRQVVAKKVDNQDTPEGGVAACKTIQNNGSYLAVSIVGFGGADVSAADCLDHAGIFVLALNLSGWSNNWTHVYSAGDAGKQTKPMASFIRNVIGDHGKIGLIHTNDPVNNAGRAALVKEIQRLGMNLVHEETVAPNQGSYIAEATHLRDSGATSVGLVVNTNEVLGILRDAKAIGYHPNWTGNYWVTDENSTAAAILFSGIKAIRNYSSTDSAAFADYKAKAQKYGHGDVANSTTMALYGIGLLVGQVLHNVGAVPAKEGLPTAIEAITNYSNGITMGLSFGPGVKVAEVSMWPIQCCNPDNTWKGIGQPKAVF